MNAREWRAACALTFVSVLRMLGMFAILPVLALYADQLPGGATAIQVGLAIALFGLVQAPLQIPFGIASDHFGRKPVVIGGVLLLAVGSFVAGRAQDIQWIMLGRALQGAGAVSAVLAAWLADITRDEVRAQAMAVHGAGVGLSFVLALVLGPVLAGSIGVKGIFTLTGVLALLSIPVLLAGVGKAPIQAPAWATTNDGALRTLRERRLLGLNGGVFLLNAMMTCLFAAMPFALVDTLGLPAARHWMFYLPVLLGSLLLVWPLLRWQGLTPVRGLMFQGAVGLLGLSLGLAAIALQSRAMLVITIVLFFIAYGYLQATMPALVSHVAAPRQRGLALGVFNTAQVLGAAIGNLIGGFARQQGGTAATLLAAALLSVIWLSFVRSGRLADRQTN